MPPWVLPGPEDPAQVHLKISSIRPKLLRNPGPGNRRRGLTKFLVGFLSPATHLAAISHHRLRRSRRTHMHQPPQAFVQTNSQTRH